MQAFEHLTVAAVRIDNPDLAGMLIDYALTQCITQRRPVYIELLQDMVDLECEPPQGELRAARTLSDEAGLKDAVATIAASLETASKPLLWMGIEVDRLGLHEQAEALVRQLNIPFVTELLSKSVLAEDDPLFAGVFDGQASSAEVQGLVEDSDFILALGVWLTDINSLGWSPAFDKIAFVSFDTVKYGTYFQAQVALEHTIDKLIASGVSRQPTPSPAVTPSAEAPTDPTAAITYSGFYDFIPRYVDENTIVGSDSSLNYFGSLLLRVPSARAFFAQPSYSTIGYISSAATGVCLAKQEDQRVMVFSGDGGFQMSAQCLSTQTRSASTPSSS